LQRERPSLALVLACGPDEERSLLELERELAAPSAGARVLFLREPIAGLGELLAHAAEADLYLGGDTGPRHLARALGTPAVIVLGPTDPRHCGRSADERLVRVSVPCGPCHLELCPLAGDEHHACMRLVEPAGIAAAALELRGRSSSILHG
jgi:ADP-heptose:LPS heptosyltransferase